MKPLAPIALVLFCGLSHSQTATFEPLHRGIPGGAGVSPYTGVAGDFDGDGIDDLIFVGTLEGSSAPASTYLLRGLAGGLFTNAWERISPAALEDVRVVDIESDGDLDLVWQGFVGLNDGTGVFQPVGSRFPPTQSNEQPVFADIDGDGDQDAVRSGTLFLEILLNDGAGLFTKGAGNLPGNIGGEALTWCDVDSDGDQDLVLSVTYVESDSLSVLLNDGTGRFTLSAVPAGPVSGIHAMVASDLDLDGDPDLVISSTSLRVFENTGDRLFALRATLSNLNAPNFTVLDVDGDGLVDIVASGAGPAWDFYRNLGDLSFSMGPGVLPIVGAAARIVKLDAGADGDTDLVYVGNDLRLWLNDAAGLLGDVTGQIPNLRNTHSAVLGDLDQDGDLDLLAQATATGISSYRNDGTGSFTRITRTPSPPGSVELLLLDAEGDGDLDAVQYSNSFGLFRCELMVNDGSGALTLMGNRFPVATSSEVARAGDMNGDGFDDVVLLTHENTVVVFLNDGKGSFSATSLRMLSGLPRDFAIGDVDGDGDLDVLLPDWGGQRNDYLLENDGKGTLRKKSLTLVRPNTTRFVAAVLLDMEGDGDLDLALLSDPTSGAVEVGFLYENDGAGAFTDVSQRWTMNTAQVDPGLLVADVDADGDRDLVGTTGGLWINDGTGVFEEATQSISGIRGVFATGDLDGDDDLDMVLRGDSEVAFNISNQLAWRDVPRIGSPLNLDLYGVADRAYLLFGSPQRSVTQTAAGTVYLSLGQLIKLGGGTTNALGRSTRTFQIPADLALVGTELHLQALWLGAPLDVTNAERVRLSAY